MRVLWELREPAASFRALGSRCDDISSSVLWQRVNELKEAGFIDASDKRGLRLTALGIDLIDSFMPLLGFAERWLKPQP